MVRFPFATVIAALFALSGIAKAQYPSNAVGFQWSSSSGASAGPFCWGFDCRAAQVRVTGGERIQLLLRAEGANAPYVIFASLSATQCLAIPGVEHALSLDFPIFPAVTGTLSQSSPILACPAFFDSFSFAFPAGLPSGGSLAVQALTFDAQRGPLLSQAIVAQVF